MRSFRWWSRIFQVMHKYLDTNRRHSIRQKKQKLGLFQVEPQWLVDQDFMSDIQGHLTLQRCRKLSHYLKMVIVVHTHVRSWTIWAKTLCPTRGLRPLRGGSHLCSKPMWLWIKFSTLVALEDAIEAFSSSGAYNLVRHSRIIWSTFIIVVRRTSICALIQRSTLVHYSHGGASRLPIQVATQLVIHEVGTHYLLQQLGCLS